MKPDELEPFLNPYRNLDDSEIARVNADVAKADSDLIRSIHVDRGFMQTAIATFIKRIADEYRKRNYTYFDRRSGQVLTMRLLRSPVDAPDADVHGVGENRTGEATPRDDNRRVNSLHQGATGDSNLEPSSAGAEANKTPKRRVVKRRRTEEREGK